MGKADKKKAAAAKKAAKKAGPTAEGAAAEEITLDQIKNLRVGDEITDEQQRVAKDRAVTGVLASPIAQLDIKFDLFTVAVTTNLFVSRDRIVCALWTLPSELPSQTLLFRAAAVVGDWSGSQG